MCCRSNNKGLIFVPKIFYICQKFLPPFFDLISRRKRRRLSLSDTVLAVTWLGIHRIFRNSNTVHSLQVHHQHLILLKLNKTSQGVHLIPTKPLFILIIIPTIRLTVQYRRFIERYPGSVSKFVSISTPHPRVWLR